MPRDSSRPKKTLPPWVEPIFIILFLATAVLEYRRGEMFWFWLFLIAATYFGFTYSAQRRK